MEIKTASGVECVNKRTPYGKWLSAYSATGAWTGWQTLSAVWHIAQKSRPCGVTWAAWGAICGNLTRNGVKIALATNKED